MSARVLTPSQRFELENLETYPDRPNSLADRAVLHDMGLIRGMVGRKWALTAAGQEMLARPLEANHGAR